MFKTIKTLDGKVIDSEPIAIKNFGDYKAVISPSGRRRFIYNDGSITEEPPYFLS